MGRTIHVALLHLAQAPATPDPRSGALQSQISEALKRQISENTEYLFWTVTV